MVSLDVGPWRGLYEDDRAAIADISALLARIATGYVDEDMSRSYNQVRNALLGNPEYADIIPRALREARTAGQFQAVVNGEVKDDQEATAHVMSMVQGLAQRAYQLSEPEGAGSPRLTEDGSLRLTEDGGVRVTEGGSPPFAAEGNAPSMEDGTTSREAASGWQGYFFPNDRATQQRAEAEAASWTGVTGRAAQLVAVRSHIQVAYVGVDQLINELSSDDGNRGPLLDEHCDAIEALRELHKCLGSLLDAIDGGQLNDELGSGFAAEIARLGSRAVDDIRDDPARHAFGLSILALLSLCGLADLGGSLAGYALGIRKKQKQSKAAEP